MSRHRQTELPAFWGCEGRFVQIFLLGGSSSLLSEDLGPMASSLRFVPLDSWKAARESQNLFLADIRRCRKILHSRPNSWLMWHVYDAVT